MAEPTPNPTKTTEPTPPTPPEPPAPNNGDNQKAIDEALAAAKAEWEKEVEEKIKKAEEEGMRKAKLTNEQRKKEEEFEKAKAEFEREKIVAYAETELAKVGLSAEIAKYIVAEDKDSTKVVIDKIKESYDKDVQAGVTERLKGKTPDLNGGSGGHNTGSFMDIIRENQR